MLIEDVMTKHVHCCRAHHSLNEAARLMWDGDCGCVPVVDNDGACIGMLTDRDVCMAAYTTGKTLREMRVADSMSRDLVSCIPMTR